MMSQKYAVRCIKCIMMSQTCVVRRFKFEVRKVKDCDHA